MQRNPKALAWMAFSAICIMAVVWTGIEFNCMNLYAAPVVEDLGITRTQFMVVLSIPGIISAIISLFFFGGIEKRIGIRRMMLIGGVLDTLAFVSWTFMNSLWMLYLGGALYGLGAGITAYTCVSAAVNRWFKQRIGTLVGVANSLGSASGIVFAVVIAALIAAVGWRYSFALCVVISALSVVACVMLYKGSPEELGVAPMYADESDGRNSDASVVPEGDLSEISGAGASTASIVKVPDRDAAGARAKSRVAALDARAADRLAATRSNAQQDEDPETLEAANGRISQKSAPIWDLQFSHAMRHPRIWVLAVGYLLLGTTTYAVMSTLPLFALDFGYGNLQGQVVSASLLAAAAAMIPLGVLCDTFGTKWGLALACSFMAVAALLLRMPSLPFAGVLAAAVFSGAAYSACGVTVGVGVKEALGEVDFSNKLGLCSGTMYVGLALGPVVTNFAYDTTGTYSAILAAFVVAGALTIAIFFAGMRKQQ